MSMSMRRTEDMNSKTDEMRVKEEFIQDTLQTQNSSTTDDVDIKYEEVDFPFHNSTADSEKKSNLDLNIGNCGSVTKVEYEDMNEFFQELLNCDRDCETCQKYIKILSEHVRAVHVPPHPIQDQDPLLIDPLHTDPDPTVSVYHLSSSVLIKCEVDESIDEMECSKEVSMSNSESYPDFESASAKDPDSSPSTPSIRKVNNGNEVQLNEQGTSFAPESNVKSKISTRKKSSTCKSDHSVIQPKEKPYRCNECGRSYSRQFDLTLHERFHTGEKLVKCDECTRCFASLSKLSIHKRMHTGEKPFKCNECEKSFSLRGDLKIHSVVHTGERAHQCDLCDKSFTTISNLTMHKRTHTGHKSFKCDQCGKTFSQNGTLTIHKITHTGERPFKCDLCEKTFTRLDKLSIHKKNHTGEKQFKCDQCEKSYTQNGSLTIHKITHTGERPFKCDVCEKSFSRRDSLNAHRKAHTSTTTLHS